MSTPTIATGIYRSPSVFLNGIDISDFISKVSLIDLSTTMPNWEMTIDLSLPLKEIDIWELSDKGEKLSIKFAPYKGESFWIEQNAFISLIHDVLNLKSFTLVPSK